MRCIPWYYLLLMLLFASRPSFAIQLHWSSGATTLSYTSATRCTLVVQAEPAEARLPAEWRLLWVSDSLPVQFVVVDSLEACLDENAQVFRIEGPATAAEIAVHDIAGRRRTTLLDGGLPGGATEVAWDGRDDRGRRLASGMYFIRLTHASGMRVSKIVMLR